MVTRGDLKNYRATRRMVTGASAFADASTEDRRKEAALELYDRVASTLGRTRDALRHATATSSNGVAEANLLFAGDADGPFTESNSRWVVTSTTTRDDDVPTDAFTLDVDATTSRSVETPVVAAALGCACTLAGVCVFLYGRRRANDARVAPDPSSSKPTPGDASYPDRIDVKCMV
mgnify:CR=1 FL=1